MTNQFQNILGQFKKQKIMVLGDLMLDKYIFGEVDRVSQEAPVPVVKVKSDDFKLGGAANVAHNIVALGGKVILGGVIGQDETGKSFLLKLKELKIETGGVLIDKSRPTIKKTRVIAVNQQVLRLDYENVRPIDRKFQQQFLTWYKKNLKQVEVVVISDYAKGFLKADLMTQVIKLAKTAKKKVLVDPKPEHRDTYRGAFMMTPNEAEARAMLEQGKELDTENLGSELQQKTGMNILITRGAKGMSLFEKGKAAVNLPTEAKEVFDVTGAGDTATAVLALGISSDLDLKEAVNWANHAAGIIVGKFGTSVLEPKEFLKKFEKESEKLKEPAELLPILAQLKKKKKKVVFTNGCFDILHVGHIKYLKEAKKLGDVLVLGLNTDASIKKLKGKNRPIVNEINRAEMISALDCVDYIVFFAEKDPCQLIGLLKPDIHVKGGDYKIEALPETKVVRSYGGKVKILKFVEGFSTTDIIEKIKTS